MNAVFIHIPKTGGTSLKAMFGAHLFVPSGAHVTYRGQRKQYLADGTRSDYDWSQMPKVAFVRNPWGRHLSFFFHGGGGDFAEHVTSTFARDRSKGTTPANMLSENVGDIFVGMFEHIANDAGRVTAELGIEAPALQHLNPCKVHDFDGDWRPYYDEATHDLVAKLGAWEIQRCGYTFDDCATRVSREAA